MTLVLTACASGGSPARPEPTETPSADESIAQMDPVVLTFSDSNLETAAHGKAVSAFMEEVTKRTDGKITFDPYWGATLHPGTEALSAVESGLTDITYVSPGQFAEQLPIEVWLGKASVLAPESFPQSLVAGSAALGEIYQSDPDIRAELAQYDARPLFYWQSAPFDALCTEPLEATSDAEGVSIRTGGGAWTGDAEALGMTNVFLPIVDLFESVQRGIIQCVNVVPSVYMTTGLWDVAKFYHPIAFSPSSTGFVISDSVLQALPLEARRIIHDALPIFYIEMLQGTMTAYQRWATESPDEGVEFVDSSSLNDLMSEHHEEVVAGLSTGAPVSDPAGLIEEYQTKLDEWGATLAEIGVPESGSAPEEVLRSYSDAIDDVPWDELRAAFAEALAEYRP
ncbi:hypothetical protein [Salinibacterium sp. ZJ454]|uniref:hypothetical protein n=1 Tax=Salinibacterium sp. ZJ454 TaxID=2708339 RepID=UPI001423C020|nr:hypothetical protein [Salinibacterium sp. ZJ454]